MPIEGLYRSGERKVHSSGASTSQQTASVFYCMPKAQSRGAVLNAATHALVDICSQAKQ